MKYRIFSKSSGELLREVDCLPQYISHQVDPMLEHYEEFFPINETGISVVGSIGGSVIHLSERYPLSNTEDH